MLSRSSAELRLILARLAREGPTRPSLSFLSAFMSSHLTAPKSGLVLQKRKETNISNARFYPRPQRFEYNLKILLTEVMFEAGQFVQEPVEGASEPESLVRG